MTGPGWPSDARGWMTLGLFVESNVIIGAMIFNPSLADIDLFKIIAQAIILQGLLQLAAAFYFTATKTGAELAAGAMATLQAQTSSTSGGGASVPDSAKEAAHQVAGAATDEAESIGGKP